MLLAILGDKFFLFGFCETVRFPASLGARFESAGLIELIPSMPIGVGIHRK